MKKQIGLLAVLAAGAVLSGCDLVVINPSGDIATQESQLIGYSTLLMLLVIVPVMLLTVFFAWHYRASNKKATYEPEWNHSISLEIVIWTLPLAIIITLAGLTWVATHRLNPYDPVTRIARDTPVPEGVEPLVVKVVAMDWKWLFIYPEEGVASINEMAAPVNRPIELQLTSTTVMNSFYIPALAGQIYAMPGMQTELNAVINEAGDYEGFSANYSGAGFSHMRFVFHGLDDAGFENWIDTVRQSKLELDRDTFVTLEQPSEKVPVTHYSNIDPELWDLAVNLCFEPSTLCHDDMMMVDALGGGGLEGLFMREQFADICTADDPVAFLSRIAEERKPQALAAHSNSQTSPSGL
ncbi:MAG: ubiquinol oxidase subunit II [Gammaproteobacteria bacterium]|nr:MAG: ubiquinol oxidase subunit II [Gammaproteobacteria bacterium]